MRAFLIILSTTILLSCAGRQDCLTLGSKLHFSKDELESDVRRSQSRQSKVGSSIRFVVVNNPYCFTEEDRIAIYMDDACVYFGSYSQNGLLAVPEEVLSRDQTNKGLNRAKSRFKPCWTQSERAIGLGLATWVFNR